MTDTKDTYAPSFPVVGIGASAGGIEALLDLFKSLPADTGMAFVIVEHLDPKSESHLSEVIAKATRMPAVTAADGAAVEPNHVYVIPPGKVLRLEQGRLRLGQRPAGPAQPVDLFFRSLAEDSGPSAIGIILSGSGSDGSLGVVDIKAAGGITFAQESAKYDDMPRAAQASGSIDFILPAPEIAAELARIAKHPYVRPRVDKRPPPLASEGETVSKILKLLRASSGVDFTHYKQTTIHRRIWRRMALHKFENIEDYYKHLKQTPGELDLLYQDVLIRVTSFFRDPSTFDALKEAIFPALLTALREDEIIRIWVPGCSTGEEVYSIAIALLEYMGEKNRHHPIQFFATDVSEIAIEKARSGMYSDGELVGVAPERLRRFFTKVENRYQTTKSVRDLCVFARQNLVSDPPFSRLDLISCRNVLIYLEAVLQKKVMPIFHYALKPNGFLMLGNSETIGGFADMFAPIDKTHRIFTKKPIPTRVHFDFVGGAYAPERLAAGVKKPSLPDEPGKGGDVQKEADRVVMSRYAPPGVLVDENLDIVQFRGQTSRFLAPAPGAPTHNLLKMAREGLLVELRSALQQARADRSPVRRDGIRVKVNGHTSDVAIEVVPLRDPGASLGYYLVLFEEAKTETGASPLPVVPPSPTPTEDTENRQLREELAATRNYLQAIIEEQEATNEELKSANEEILSSNEELQSTNEELETAKEELQSTNEELTTVNEELQNRNQELSQVNNDLNNLLASVNIPVIMLGNDLKIRRFTPMAEKMLRLIPGDIGRSIVDINLPLDLPGLEQTLVGVIDTITTHEQEVVDRSGRWLSLRLRPYRTNANKIDGVVMILLDIDDVKRSQLKACQAIIDIVSQPVLLLTGDLKVKMANPVFYEKFRLAPPDVEGQIIYHLGAGQWNISPLRTLLEDVLPRNIQVLDFELKHEFPQAGFKRVKLNARRFAQQSDNHSAMILLSIRDADAAP